MRKLAMIGMLAVALVGCGEDDEGGGNAGGGGGGGAPKPAAKPKKPAAPGKALVPRLKVEDRVTDPQEKVSIRHQFRDRDFAAEQSNRDPFQSYVLGRQAIPTTTTDTALSMDITKKCTREDQFVATSYSYQDLRLVGIVAERTQRKVLMMDRGNLGHIIKKGDCVGREKALVKDIGAGFVTFQVQPDAPQGASPGAIEEHSIQLYPNQLPVMSQPTPDPQSNAPVVAPGSGPAPSDMPAPVVPTP